MKTRPKQGKSDPQDQTDWPTDYKMVYKDLLYMLLYYALYILLRSRAIVSLFHKFDVNDSSR